VKQDATSKGSQPTADCGVIDVECKKVTLWRYYLDFRWLDN